MSEWCRRCGEGADTADEILHDIECPAEVVMLDDLDVEDDLDQFDFLPIPIDDTHGNCRHRMGTRSIEECNRRRRQARAAARALGGL